jgi:hypothetical protein
VGKGAEKARRVGRVIFESAVVLHEEVGKIDAVGVDFPFWFPAVHLSLPEGLPVRSLPGRRAIHAASDNDLLSLSAFL